VKELHIEV